MKKIVCLVLTGLIAIHSDLICKSTTDFNQSTIVYNSSELETAKKNYQNTHETYSGDATVSESVKSKRKADLEEKKHVYIRANVQPQLQNELQKVSGVTGCAPVDQPVTASTYAACPDGGGATITVASSEQGVVYYLRNDANDTIIAGPIIGNGSALSFYTGNITSTMTYNVYAERFNSGALKFDGNSGARKVSLGTTLYADNIAGATQLTIEAWIKRSASGSLHTILSNYEGSYPLLLRIDNNRLNFYVNSSASVQSSSTIPVGVWTHVAATYSGSQIRVYINGVLEGSQSYSQPFISTSNVLKIGGGLNNNTEYFPGDIADVRIWNYERSAVDISNTMNQVLSGSESGLIANYKFLEGSGSIAANSAVGNLYPGTLINNPSWTFGPPVLNSTGCAREMSQLVTITVSDVTAPVPGIANLPDIVAECEVTSLSQPTATDGCAGISGLNIWPPASIAGENTNVGLSTLGPQIFNLSAPCIVAYDLTPDPFVCDSITDDLTGKIVVIRSGICSLQTKLTNVQAKGAIGVIVANNVGGTTVVNDATINPSIVIPTLLISQNDGTALMDEITLNGNVYVTMIRKAPLAITHNATLPITTQGTTVVTWTYDDGHGNTTTQNQNVIIQDTTNPVISGPANQTETTAGPCEFMLPDYTVLATASDNCTAVPTITQSPAPGTVVYGNTTITLTATDGSSNIDTSMFDVLLPMIQTIDNTVDISSAPLLTANQSGASYQWIDCDNSNAPIAGETNQSFTATANGNYAVIITQNGCSYTSACINVTTVGNKESNSLTEISIYPNPSTGIYNLSGLELNSQITVYDAIGQIIYTSISRKPEEIVTISNSPNGVYIIIIKSKDEMMAKKLIKGD